MSSPLILLATLLLFLHSGSSATFGVRTFTQRSSEVGKQEWLKCTVSKPYYVQQWGLTWRLKEEKNSKTIYKPIYTYSPYSRRHKYKYVGRDLTFSSRMAGTTLYVREKDRTVTNRVYCCLAHVIRPVRLNHLTASGCTRVMYPVKYTRPTAAAITTTTTTTAAAPDHCASNPCINGGVCSINAWDYYYKSWKCKCRGMYFGRTCEKSKNRCEIKGRVLCRNGGTCNNLWTHHTCTCPEGWQGRRCDKASSACASSPCKHGGTCSKTMRGYQCICPKGYETTNCDESYCASKPCQHGGKCKPKRYKDGYYCICHRNYGGINCEKNRKMCNSRPCLNGATCTNGINKYTCACRRGYEGAQCQTATDTNGSNLALKDPGTVQADRQGSGVDNAMTKPYATGATVVGSVLVVTLLSSIGIVLYMRYRKEEEEKLPPNEVIENAE